MNELNLIDNPEYVSGAVPDTGPKPGLNAYSACSHVANAQRIVQHFGKRLLYVEGIGWHTWGGPWKHDELGARKVAQGLGKIIAEEAGELGAWVGAAKDKGQREEREKVMAARFKWAGTSESAPCVELSLQAAMPWLCTKAANLDANPMLLGLPNGVLDLATGEHREHRQEDHITKLAGASFDPHALAPHWERFVSEVFDGDEALICYV